MLDSQLIAEEFADLQSVVFLNVSSVVMPPRSVQEAYFGFTQRYLASFGDEVVPNGWEIANATRVDIGQLINANPSEVAFVKNTSEGIGIFASGYPFRPGDNVVVADQEHPANLYAWVGLQRKGVELRVVRSRGVGIELADIFRAVDERTRVVAVSAVQFTTGFRIDLASLGAFCESRNVLLVVDGVQAVGRLKIDVKALKIAYLSCGGNKGLLATLGAGFVYCRANLVETIIPPYACYQSVESHVKPPALTQDFSAVPWRKDARRFEAGNLNYAGVAAIQAGVRLINRLGIEEIERQVYQCEDALLEGIASLPLNLRVPPTRENRSGIVCVYYAEEAEDRVVEILKRHRIHATMRGGYIRLGIDFYNTVEQMRIVARALEEISAVQPGRSPA